MFKEINESLRIFIPLVLFILLAIYLLISDSSVVGPI